MSRTAVLNAFSPAHEVIDPSAFAGRTTEIREVADALQVIGSCPVIYGDRGLGKSSLAVQAQLIAMGDGQLLTAIGAESWIIPEDSTFLTFYVTCTDEIKGLEDLLLLIIHQMEDVDLERGGSANGETLVDRRTRRKLTFKIFEAETAKTYVQRTKRLRLDELKPSERLRREIQILQEVTEQPVLIVVDELDRARRLDGLASFLKAISNASAKFLLVGIAQNLSDLHLNHASLERQLMPIHVPRMTRGELADVIDRATSKLKEQGYDYTFAQAARTRLVRVAAGFPWFVHVIGQAALLEALNRGETVVTDDILIQASRGLVQNRFAQHFSDAYQRAVQGSYQREIVLRVCAAWGGSNIPTSEVYPVCQKLRVTNPAVYRGQLTAEKYGEPLMVPGYQQRGLLRFRNEMFKQYVNLTDGLYEGVADDVRKATASW